MFSILKSIYVGNEKCLVQAACKTADTKPTDGIANGSICFDMEASAFSMFDEASSAWVDLD